MTGLAFAGREGLRVQAPPPEAGASAALAEAYAECARITRASGSSFAHAFRLLPEDRRRGLEALYAWCRVIDDAADEGADPATALSGWRDELGRALGGRATRPVTSALADTVSRFGIPARHLDEILTGVEMDLTRRRYETFEELDRYCYHVAGAVGLATIHILGCRDERSRAYAEALGVALQLTNILRDLPEDAERGRVYLPLEDLRRFGYGERELLTHTRNSAFLRLVAFECERAEEFYQRARKSVARADRRALAPAEAMRLVYQRLLRRIAARPALVFGPRVGVPRWEKGVCLVGAWLRSGGWRRDPR